MEYRKDSFRSQIIGQINTTIGLIVPCQLYIHSSTRYIPCLAPVPATVQTVLADAQSLQGIISDDCREGKINKFEEDGETEAGNQNKYLFVLRSPAAVLALSPSHDC